MAHVPKCFAFHFLSSLLVLPLLFVFLLLLFPAPALGAATGVAERIYQAISLRIDGEIHSLPVGAAPNICLTLLAGLAVLAAAVPLAELAYHMANKQLLEQCTSHM